MTTYMFIYMHTQNYLVQRDKHIPMPATEDGIHDLVCEIEDHMFIHNYALYNSYTGQDENTRRLEILVALVSILVQKNSRLQDEAIYE